ncbi:MAG: peptidoglycan DD-metalloendopeptidase family protein [Bacteroidetes bacterium]|nr:peptidoglycan DD-metalloendopeptidase family protein [Bacteroidota bacterium]
MPSKPSTTGAKTKKTLINQLLEKKALFSFVGASSFLLVTGLGHSQVVFSGGEFIYSPEASSYNSQSVGLLSPKFIPSTKGPIGGSEEVRIEGDAIVASSVSPITDIKKDKIVSTSPDDISIYTVREGDTLSQIAEMFEISPNTIRWANDIDVKGTIKPGQDLIILPISGLKHKVAKGETIESIAKKFEGDAREIRIFNGIEEGQALIAGTEIIIPNGEADVKTETKSVASVKGSPSKEVPSGYYIKPVKGIKTQGEHDRYHAIDIGAPTGTPVWAMAGGKVLITKSTSAWNGGYGGMVIISHDNGTQTLYAHLSKINVSSGQTVKQGDVIGAIGSTGRSTGPHLHIEIRTGSTGISGISILEKMY